MFYLFYLNIIILRQVMDINNLLRLVKLILNFVQQPLEILHLIGMILHNHAIFALLIVLHV